jgi:hypothetical protein
MGWGFGWIAWWAWGCLQAGWRKTRSDPTVNWAFWWVVAILLFALGWVIKRIVGVETHGWSTWALFTVGVLVTALIRNLGLLSYIFRPDWKPPRRHGQAPDSKEQPPSPPIPVAERCPCNGMPWCRHGRASPPPPGPDWWAKLCGWSPEAIAQVKAERAEAERPRHDGGEDPDQQ